MEISQIKQNLSLQQVLGHYNLQPNKNKMLKCPFHEDKTPGWCERLARTHKQYKTKPLQIEVVF
jgi:hypothetical protein